MIATFSTVSAADRRNDKKNAVVYEEVHEFDDVVTELNSLDYKRAVSGLQEARAALDAELSEISKDTPIPGISIGDVSTSRLDDPSLALSERLTLIKELMNKYTEIIADSQLALSLSSERMYSVTQRYTEMCKWYDQILNILERMSESQLSDLGLSQKLLADALEETEELKKRMAVIQALEQRQHEKLLTLEAAQKRIRTLSMVEIGVGLPLLIIGATVPFPDQYSSFQRACTGVGAALTVAGGAGLIFTIHF